MEEVDSQTVQVGPSNLGLSVGTYVSIKKNKQNLSYICQKMHANPEAFLRNNSDNSKEMQNAISGIVDLIENTPFAENAEITKICVWTSNMIICADSAYREDFIASSKNIFQALSAHFVRVSPSQTENNSNNEEYQTLALIYRLLMSTRRPQESVGSKKGGFSDSEKQENNVKAMREKLLNKEFMRKILEINPEEFAPSAGLVVETQKMLIAFLSLFAKKKDRIVSFGLVRSAKDRILETISNLYTSGKSTAAPSSSDASIHQALACLNAMIDNLKLSAKELAKHNLVVILADLLDSNNTTTVQLTILLRILLIITKQNLLSFKPSYMTLCLGKAFKVFEKVPSQAAQLIAEIVRHDPLALNDITLSTTLALLRDITARWNEASFLKRTQKPNTVLRTQLTHMLLEIEGKMKYLVQIVTLLVPSANTSLSLALNGGLDVVLFPLLNCLEFPVTSNSSPFELSRSSSQEDSTSGHQFLKIEEEADQEDSLGTVSNFPGNHQQQQKLKTHNDYNNNNNNNTKTPTFAPSDVQLYEAILKLVEMLLASQSKASQEQSSNNSTGILNINAVPIPSVPSSSYTSTNAHSPSFRNEPQNIVLLKLISVELPALLTSLLTALKADYARLASISTATLLPKLQAFAPVAQTAARLLAIISAHHCSLLENTQNNKNMSSQQQSSTNSGVSQQRV